MASKAGNDKRHWTDTHKKSNANADVKRRSRREKRIADQKAREAQNKVLRRDGYLTPWEAAKLLRAERREGKQMTPRTRYGNLVRKLEDGTTRIEPGTKQEQSSYLATLEKERTEEIKRAAEERTKERAKAKKEKAKKEKAA